jgi:UPF0716 family protein affecting phage T7 exclusion
MARFLTLGLLALLAVAEVGVVLGLIDRIGGPATLLVLLVDMLVGVGVMRWGARSAPPVRGWRIAGGAFIALPGLVLDLVGLALLVPTVQRWVAGHVLRGTEAAMRSRGVSVITVTDATGVPRTTVVPGDVIPGQVVEDSGSPSETGVGNTTDRAGGAPEPGPRVVRGEIADTED